MTTIEYIKQVSDNQIFKACAEILDRDINSRNVDAVIDKLLEKVTLDDEESFIRYEDMYPYIEDRIKEQFIEADLLFL